MGEKKINKESICLEIYDFNKCFEKYLQELRRSRIYGDIENSLKDYISLEIANLSKHKDSYVVIEFYDDNTLTVEGYSDYDYVTLIKSNINDNHFGSYLRDYFWEETSELYSDNISTSTLNNTYNTYNTYSTYSTTPVDTNQFNNVYTARDIDSEVNELQNKLARVETQIEDLKDVIKCNKNITKESEREENNMKKMFNFDFGPVDSNIRMSPYGMAIKNKEGRYVAYDAKTGDIMDVEILNFEGSNFIYKMPCALNAITAGDVIVHNRVPMFVTRVGTAVDVVDIFSGEIKAIKPTKSPFGFNFVTKIVSLIDFGNVNSDNPFGNMWPLMLMGQDGIDNKDMLMMMAFSQGGNMANNPMLMYAMMGDHGINDMMMAMMFANGGIFPGIQPNANHACGCHKTEEPVTQG